MLRRFMGLLLARFYCECKEPSGIRDMGDHFICEDCGGEIAEYE